MIDDEVAARDRALVAVVCARQRPHTGIGVKDVRFVQRRPRKEPARLIEEIPHFLSRRCRARWIAVVAQIRRPDEGVAIPRQDEERPAIGVCGREDRLPGRIRPVDDEVAAFCAADQCVMPLRVASPKHLVDPRARGVDDRRPGSLAFLAGQLIAHNRAAQHAAG